MAHADTDPARPGHRRVGGLVLIRNISGHVLLVKPTDKDGWQLVGGGALPGEPPHLAARREAIEETGLAGLIPGALLIVDYIPANPNTGAAEGLNFVFDADPVPDGTTITLPAAKPGEQPELGNWTFVPPSQLGDYCQPYQHRRIIEALDALHDPNRRGFRVRGRAV